MKRRIIITEYRPWVRWAIVCAATVLVATGAWALYSYTRATTVSDFQKAQLERDTLLQERRELSRELRTAKQQVQDLQDQVVYLQRSQEIDNQACDTVKTSLKSLQSEVSDLQEQVAFYRGIVSPAESRTGVRVYDLKIARASTPNRYHLELVLIQSVRHDRRVAGRVEVTLRGTQAGASRELALRDMAPEVARNLVFSFKYFQEFSGEFNLPADFKPMRVAVAVAPDGGQPRLEDVFDWPKIQGE